MSVQKDGPFVYRLGRKIFILERGVRFPHGLQKKPFQRKFETAFFLLVNTNYKKEVPKRLSSLYAPHKIQKHDYLHNQNMTPKRKPA